MPIRGLVYFISSVTSQRPLFACRRPIFLPALMVNTGFHLLAFRSFPHQGRSALGLLSCVGLSSICLMFEMIQKVVLSFVSCLIMIRPFMYVVSMLLIITLIATTSLSLFAIVDPSVPTILSGDFNVVFDCSVDRRGSCSSSASCDSSNTLSSLFRNCCVLDIWRVLHPLQLGFT